MRENEVKEESRRYFDSTAGGYDSSRDGRFVRCTYEKIVALCLAARPASVLDLGCGNGNILALLAAKSGARLCGIDLSPNMVAAARQKLGERARLLVGDAAALPLESASFSLVVCNASFHHYPAPAQVLTEIRRVLAPGGTLVLGDPTAPSLLRGPLNLALRHGGTGDYHIYGKREICVLLRGQGFTVRSWQRPNYKNFILSATAPGK